MAAQVPIKRTFMLGAVAFFAVASCSTLPISDTDDVCNIFGTKNRWHKSAVKVQNQWRVPLHIPMAVMYHESKFRRNAKAPRRQLLGFIPWKRRSSAFGYSQAVNSTWDAYLKETKNYGARRNNFHDSIDFIGWYIDKSAKLADIPKTDPYNQYLAYHEGWTGFRKGSYRQKQWLQRVAGEVATTSERYRTQYNACVGQL